MTRAVLKDGMIVPLDPLPSEWVEGQELIVEPNPEALISDEDFDEWEKKFRDVGGEPDPEDARQLMETLDTQHRESKTQMRREMGLPG